MIMLFELFQNQGNEKGSIFLQVLTISIYAFYF